MSSTFSTGPLAFVLILTAVGASWVFDWFEQAFREFLNDRGDAFADAYGDIPALHEEMSAATRKDLGGRQAASGSGARDALKAVDRTHGEAK